MSNNKELRKIKKERRRKKNGVYHVAGQSIQPKRKAVCVAITHTTIENNVCGCGCECFVFSTYTTFYAFLAAIARFPVFFIRTKWRISEIPHLFFPFGTGTRHKHI